MALVDVVKWNAIPGMLVWKFPSEALSTMSQLVVSESQEAVLLKDGKLLGVFGPGRYTLDTNNIPLLRFFVQLPFGGKSPYAAEVWFINKAITLDVKWGTTDPIQLMDPKYKIMLPVRAYGQFGIKVEESAKFLIKLVGTFSAYDVNTLTSYFKGVIVSNAKEAIARKLVQDGTSLLEINAQLTEISDHLQGVMSGDLSDFGLTLSLFKVMSINAPESDPAVQRIKAALARKAEMTIVGFDYQQERSFNTIEAAASNPGAGSTMNAGMGLGIGFGVGGAVGNAAASMAQQMTFQPPVPAPSATPALMPCAKCGAARMLGAKFCPGCGAVYNLCTACNGDNPEAVLTCGRCGGPMLIPCPGCAKPVLSNERFCSSCGKAVQSACSKCGKVAPPSTKFCPDCGTPLSPSTEG